jgi:hypothetical protein
MKENFYETIKELVNSGEKTKDIIEMFGKENKNKISIYVGKIKRELKKNKNNDGFFNVHEFENWIM